MWSDDDPASTVAGACRSWSSFRVSATAAGRASRDELIACGWIGIIKFILSVVPTFSHWTSAVCQRSMFSMTVSAVCDRRNETIAFRRHWRLEPQRIGAVRKPANPASPSCAGRTVRTLGGSKPRWRSSASARSVSAGNITRPKLVILRGHSEAPLSQNAARIF